MTINIISQLLCIPSTPPYLIVNSLYRVINDKN